MKQYCQNCEKFVDSRGMKKHIAMHFKRRETVTIKMMHGSKVHVITRFPSLEMMILHNQKPLEQRGVKYDETV